MAQALQQPASFDDFVEWLPETSECRYELHRGVIVDRAALANEPRWEQESITHPRKHDQADCGGRFNSIYNLTNEREYEVQQFRGDDRLLSPTFADLPLTADQVFAAEQ